MNQILEKKYLSEIDKIVRNIHLEKGLFDEEGFLSIKYLENCEELNIVKKTLLINITEKYKNEAKKEEI